MSTAQIYSTFPACKLRFRSHEKPRLTWNGVYWTCRCSRYEGYGFIPLNAWRAWNDKDIRLERIPK